jgi:hypothetical protein
MADTTDDIRALHDGMVAEASRVDKLACVQMALKAERVLHDQLRRQYAELQRIVEERGTIMADMKRIANEQSATMQVQHDLIARLSARLGIEPPDDLTPRLH